MVDELEKNKIIATDSVIGRVEELERIDLEEENSLMATNETRSVKDNGRVCHPIGKNLFDKQYFLDNINNFVSIVNGYWYELELDNNFKNNLAGSIYLSGTTQLNYSIALSTVSGLSPYANLRLLINDGSIYNRIYDFTNAEHVYLQIGSDNSHISLETRLNYIFNNYSIQIEQGPQFTSYEPYEGCLYGLELYDTIEPNFMTDNYYINCGIISIFLALIILIVNAPFIFIRKIKGN